MIEPTRDIETPTTNRDLVFQFFAFFSRFEYSLKRSNFLKASDKAEPNWDTYANTLRGRFDAVQDQGFQAAVAFLVAEPPKTQIVRGNDLGWKNTVQGAGEHKVRYVLRLISVVRNNLFHGGKYPYPFGPVDDAARDRSLLEAAISILKQCLDLSETVRTKFGDKA